MRNRFLVAFALGTLLAASVPALASAGEVPGRPGQFPVSIHIWYETVQGTHCYAQYEPPPLLGDEDIGTGEDGFATVKLVQNKKHVKVTCKTVDISGTWEANAEVGYADSNCFLHVGEDKDYVEYHEGDGKVTRANNLKVTPDGEPGSNVTMMCKFDLPEDER